MKYFWDPFVEFTDSEMDFFSYGEANLPRKGVFLRLIIYLYSILRFLFSRQKNPGIKSNLIKSRSHKNIWVLSGSNHESQSLLFVNDIENVNIIDIGLNGNKALHLAGYILGIFTIPYLLFIYIYSDEPHKKLFPYLIDSMMYLNGLTYILFLYKYVRPPNYILYSNHVSPLCRSVINIFKNKPEISIIYIEHVPMLSYWPNVNADIFFLSGEFSLFNMRKRTCISGKEVFLVGPSRNEDLDVSDKLIDCNLDIVGIAVSPIDNISNIVNFIKSALKKDPLLRFIVRPHPSMRKSKLIKALNPFKENIEIHSTQTMSLNLFFQSIDLLIVNDSGIFFESAIAETPILRIKFSDFDSNIYCVPPEFNKYYHSLDYVSSNLSSIFLGENPQALKKYLFKNYQTKYWGKSRELKVKIFESILSNNFDDELNKFKFTK